MAPQQVRGLAYYQTVVAQSMPIRANFSEWGVHQQTDPTPPSALKHSLLSGEVTGAAVVKAEPQPH